MTKMSLVEKVEKTNKILDALKDPELTKEAEKNHRKLSHISVEEMYKEFDL